MTIGYILILCCLAIKIIYRFDPESGLKLTTGNKVFFGCGAIAGGIWIDIKNYEMIVYGIFIAYLLVSVYTDWQIMKAYDFVAFIAALAGVLLLLLAAPESRGSLQELLVFVVLQWLLFARLTGSADCIALSICAVFITLHGGGMLEYLLHMLIAVVLCGGFQLVKYRSLKHAVPFIPFIAMSVFLFI